MKTSTIKPSAPKWLLIDAKGETLGKIAVKAAMILRGKHKASFSPHQLCGDHVVVINASDIKVPPKKGLRKTYYRHTGFVGNMKITPFDKMLEKRPTLVIEHAVKGMLEATRLRQQMMRRLHVFADDQHGYDAQKPEPITLTSSRS